MGNHRQLGKDQKGIRRRRLRTVYGTKANAQKELRELVDEVEQERSRRGIWLVGAWLRTWHREVVRHDCRVKTQERYAGIIEQQLIPHLGEINMAKLSPRHVEPLYQRLSSQGMNARTIRLVPCVLLGACKHALRREPVDRNVAGLVSPSSAPKREVVPPGDRDGKGVALSGPERGASAVPIPVRPDLHRDAERRIVRT